MAAMRREFNKGYQSIDGASLILRCFPAISTPGLWPGPHQRSSGPCGTLGPDEAKKAGEGTVSLPCFFHVWLRLSQRCEAHALKDRAGLRALNDAFVWFVRIFIPGHIRV